MEISNQWIGKKTTIKQTTKKTNLLDWDNVSSFGIHNTFGGRLFLISLEIMQVIATKLSAF